MLSSIAIAFFITTTFFICLYVTNESVEIKIFYKMSMRAKVAVFTIVLIIIWSILNYYFFINILILHNYFDFGVLKSIRISSNLTGELSAEWYYFKLLLIKSFGIGGDKVVSEMCTHMDGLLSQLDNLNSLKSGSSMIQNIFF